jgi:hypothetical protein
VPYYLSQIYYKTGEIDELLRVGEALLEQAVASRAAEVAKLIGEGILPKERLEIRCTLFRKTPSFGW